MCLGNICRSPYGEVKLKSLLQGVQQSQVKVASAGISAMVDQGAEPNSQKVAKVRGLNLTLHRAQQLTAKLVDEFELILVMDEQQKEIVEYKFPRAAGKVQSIGRWSDEAIDDPYRKPYKAYEHMADRIDVCLLEWMKNMND